MAALRTFWAKVTGGGGGVEAEAAPAFVLAPVTPKPPDLDDQQWFVRRRPDFGVGSRARMALDLPGEHEALRQQIEMADRYAGRGDYRTANQMLDDAERLVERQFERLSDKPVDYLAQSFNLLDSESLKSLVGRLSSETAAEVAARLDLDDFQEVLVKIKGHVHAKAMIEQLPMERVEHLMRAKGVDPDQVALRAGRTGRDAEQLRRRAVELVLLCPGIAPELIEDLAFCGDLLADGHEAMRLLDPLNEELRASPPTHCRRAGAGLRITRADIGSANQGSRTSLPRCRFGSCRDPLWGNLFGNDGLGIHAQGSGRGAGAW